MTTEIGRREHPQMFRLSRTDHFNKHNKRLRKDIRSVPWRDEWELQMVGKSLLSVLQQQQQQQHPRDDDDDNLHDNNSTAMPVSEAFAMISVWKSRLNATEGLPHAIESTGALAQVYWRDSRRRNPSRTSLPSTAPSTLTVVTTTSSSVTELRLAYASAIVRCINGFADSLQQQRAMAASVSSLCGYLGIPSWLVDIRHEAAHNALPAIEVLRLATSTLLEFLKSEYWIPTCPNWQNHESEEEETMGSDRTNNGGADNHHIDHANSCGGAQGRDTTTVSEKRPRPIDVLVEYKACAAAWATANRSNINIDGTETSKTAGATGSSTSKRKKKSSATPPKTTILPYDPLFGEVCPLGSGSSDDDDDDDENDDDNDDDDVEDDPVVGSIWGSSIGTYKNRFALLEPPKNDKKRKLKVTIQSSPQKKKKGEKSPTDCAKMFVRSVTPQDGHPIAIQFLVWGGVGGAPAGRGVLIPGSEKAFPATPQGISKCWQRYSPLIHVVCRAWPGFCSTLLVHLVDFALSIENSVVEQSHLDPGSARKLYFISAWIRLILSQRFVSSLDRVFSLKHINNHVQKKGSNNSAELDLARSEHLEALGYPLNSILDRCFQYHSSNDEENDRNDPSKDLRKTSRDILLSLEEIIGPQKVHNFGYTEVNHSTNNTVQCKPTNAILPVQENVNVIAWKTSSDDVNNNDRDISTNNGNSKSAAPMSLDEMEAMLLGDDETELSPTKGENADEKDAKPRLSHTEVSKPEDVHLERPAWVLCEHWDACAIGSLPGYPV